MFRSLSFFVFLFLVSVACKAQTDSTGFNPNWDYQIYLKQPAKNIKELLYYNDCDSVNGRLSDDGKSIIVKDYQRKSRIYVKIIYQDGTEDEFTRSSCFIDPVL